MKEGLENYYGNNGDRAWANIVEISKTYWTNSDYQIKLLNKLEGHKDIAIVIYDRMGDSSLEWIEKKVPGLNNITPLECLKSPVLLLRLKEALMRMG